MLSSFGNEEMRRSVQAYVIAKHRELYWRRLPEVLLAAQRASGDLFRLAREHERLHAEAGAALRTERLQLDVSAVEQEALLRDIAKHRELYWHRLPEVLLAAQRASGDLLRLSREHERLHAEAGAALRAQKLQLDASAVEQEALLREMDALRAERERLYAELDAWSQRVAFMESTRAWRVRRWLVDVKRSLKR
jgi:post-segregation antitoxin (ccd killing protein)